MLRSPGCCKNNTTHITLCRCQRHSQELSFSDPLSSDHRLKALLSFGDTKRTFPAASGVPGLSWELNQTLKADPVTVGVASGLLPAEQCRRKRNKKRPKHRLPGLSIYGFFTGSETRFQLKPEEIRLERLARWRCQIASHRRT